MGRDKTQDKNIHGEKPGNGSGPGQYAITCFSDIAGEFTRSLFTRSYFHLFLFCDWHFGLRLVCPCLCSRRYLVTSLLFKAALSVQCDNIMGWRQKVCLSATVLPSVILCQFPVHNCGWSTSPHSPQDSLQAQVYQGHGQTNVEQEDIHMQAGFVVYYAESYHNHITL